MNFESKQLGNKSHKTFITDKLQSLVDIIVIHEAFSLPKNKFDHKSEYEYEIQVESRIFSRVEAPTLLSASIVVVRDSFVLEQKAI